jgi:hypothetical protein
MVSNLPEGEKFMSMIEEAMLGDNTCLFKQFRLKVRGKRMSGEMCTSLGNSFSNLMLMLYYCKKFGSECLGVVEGDDGLFIVVGKIPTAEDFAKLGFVIKLQVVDELEKASFCGLVFDIKDLINVTDPIKELVSFFQLPARYMSAKSSKLRGLYRCKALSLAHQYNGCPILSSLAKYILRITNFVDRKFVVKYATAQSNYYMQRFLDMKLDCFDFKTPPINTRLLVAELYGVSIPQQHNIESFLDAQDDFVMFPDSLFNSQRDWRCYWDNYVIKTSMWRETDRISMSFPSLDSPNVTSE